MLEKDCKIFLWVENSFSTNSQHILSRSKYKKSSKISLSDGTIWERVTID